jgi:threonine dehydrogenase-like Zn-dependent dehydrogenase
LRGVYLSDYMTAETRETPTPSAGPGEVLVRIRASAICGSDLHRYRATDPSQRYGEVIAGHEPCGIVEETGPGVLGVRPGDRVVVYHMFGCGRCDACRVGDFRHCPRKGSYGRFRDGGDAEFMVVPEINCLPLPETLSYVAGAVLACNGGTAYNAIRRAQVAGGDTLAVSGVGPVGLCCILFGAAKGARIIAVDLSESRLRLASDLGAADTIDARAGDVAARVRELTGGRGVDAAVETSGAAPAHQALLGSLGFEGRGVFVGFGARGLTANLTQIIGQQQTLLGSQIFDIAEFPRILGSVLRNRVDLERVVTHRYSLDDAQQAFRVADGAAAGKVVFVA